MQGKLNDIFNRKPDGPVTLTRSKLMDNNINNKNKQYLFHVYIQTETFYLICNMSSETMLILTTIPITQITNNTKTKTISSKSTDPEYDFCF